MTPLRVATIGAGYFSQFHHDAWARMEDVRLVAVCDQDACKAAEFVKRYGVATSYSDPAVMLDVEKPDLLDIVTPPASHLPLIRLAAARGINTICQKPFCRDLVEARAAASIAEADGIHLVVHENFRFQPWYAVIKRRIDDGDLGDLHQVTFRLRPGDGQGPRAYLDRQPYFQTLQHFLVHETAIHFVDTFRFLLGEYRSVFAELRRINPVIAGEDGGFLIFEHVSGVRSLFDGNRLIDHAAENKRLTMGEMLVEGTRAVLRLDGNGCLYRRAFGENTEHEIAYNWTRLGYAGDSVMRLQRHVVDAIRGRGALINSARDYLRCLEIEAALYQSASERAVKRV
jgi:predicted dehydrogenase